MKMHTSYSVKIKEYNHIFQDSVRLYRSAVTFFMDVMERHWDIFSVVYSRIDAVKLTEKLTIVTAKRPVVSYDFGKLFYKFPSYLRRSAIAEA